MRTLDGAVLIGRRFGSRVVIDTAPSGSGGVRVLARCDCGRERAVYARRLLNGSAWHCLGCDLAARVEAPRWDGRWDTLTAEEVERFWSYIEQRGPNECWLWTRFRSPLGYGRWMVRGFPVGAAGLALALTTKTQRTYGEVLHSCDNPPCCNPAHLRIGTHAENMREAADRGRMVRSSLDAAAVQQIRARAASGERLADLAQDFKVGRHTISAVVRRKTWRHVP